MEKRKLEKLGIETSLLGFGCMRFPTKDGKIDEALAEQMLDDAYKAGVNYFDTAWPYHNGESEPFLGKCMTKYPRDTFYLATKLPCWAVNELADAERIFATQLEHLCTDHVDFYLLHALGKERFEKMVELGVVELLEKYKAEGKIKYLGFSFHDSFEAFETIIKYKEWDFCQIQYNYFDTQDGPGKRGYDLAEELNVPIVIMEPVRGGALAKLADEIEDVFRGIKPEMSTASWALRWVASRPQVKVVLSGMSSPEQLQDNLNTFNNYANLSDVEENAVQTAVDMIRARVRNKCTGCRYCVPCPAGVAIPNVFSVWNQYGMFGNPGSAKWNWGQIKPEARPDVCVECGACEDACPQHLPIREDLKKANAELSALE